MGAYTSSANPKGRVFATEAVRGDKLTLEYEPTTDERPQIVLSGLGYCYRDPASSDTRLRVNESMSCEVNVNCREGNNWQHQKKGVARTITPIGEAAYLCSGSLVNNTSGEVIPYYLSAHHCFYDKLDNQAIFSRMIFYFHYEHPSCEYSDQPPLTTKTLVGAQLLVDIDMQGGSDGALLRLDNDVPEDYRVFYNGWSINEDSPEKGVGIHHPAGDVKKISTYTEPAQSATWRSTGATGAADAHWNAIFSKTENGHGVTEGGSSGSPLFNQDKLITGTLSGGNSSCSHLHGSNLYGKLSAHWDCFPKKMQVYLDPDNTGIKQLPGRYAGNESFIDFSADKDSIYTGESIHFIDLSFGAGAIEWSFPGGIPETSADNAPTVVYKQAGIYPVRLYSDKGTPNEKADSSDFYITVEERPGALRKESLTARFEENRKTVALAWKAHNWDAETVEPEKHSPTLRWDNGTMYTRERLLPKGSCQIFSVWTPGDLARYEDMQINDVYICPASDQATYRLQIIQSGDLLYDRELTMFTEGVFNRYRLQTPLRVDLSKELWLGYHVVHDNTVYPVAVDRGPIKPGRNIVVFGDEKYAAESFSISGNWNIAFRADVTERPAFSYRIYRDGVLKADSLTVFQWEDAFPDFSLPSHTYEVQTLFRDAEDNTGNAQVMVELPDTDGRISQITVDRKNRSLNVSAAYPIQTVTVCDANGKMIFHRAGMDTRSLTLSLERAGTGFILIAVKTANGTEYHKGLM